MRRQHRTDANQREVVNTLRKLGASVELLHNVGSGCPDLAIGFRGRTWLMEVKGEASVKKYPPDGRTERQKAWHRAWQGSPVLTVKSPAEAVDALL